MVVVIRVVGHANVGHCVGDFLVEEIGVADGRLSTDDTRDVEVVGVDIGQHGAITQELGLVYDTHTSTYIA